MRTHSLSFPRTARGIALMNFISDSRNQLGDSDLKGCKGFLCRCRLVDSPGKTYKTCQESDTRMTEYCFVFYMAVVGNGVCILAR